MYTAPPGESQAPRRPPRLDPPPPGSRPLGEPNQISYQWVTRERVRSVEKKASKKYHEYIAANIANVDFPTSQVSSKNFDEGKPPKTQKIARP